MLQNALAAAATIVGLLGYSRRDLLWPYARLAQEGAEKREVGRGSETRLERKSSDVRINRST